MIDVDVNVNHCRPVHPTDTSTTTGTAAAPRPAARSGPGTAARTWTVRELADELGVTTRTLRFYEAEGLIAPERRGTARIYHPRDRTRLRLIMRGKRFGMSLTEIREIVGMYDGAASSERHQLETLLGRLAEIRTDLRRRRDDLQRLLEEIETVSVSCEDRLTELGPAPA